MPLIPPNLTLESIIFFLIQSPLLIYSNLMPLIKSQVPIRGVGKRNYIFCLYYLLIIKGIYPLNPKPVLKAFYNNRKPKIFVSKKRVQISLTMDFLLLLLFMDSSLPIIVRNTLLAQLSLSQSLLANINPYRPQTPYTKEYYSYMLDYIF